MRILIWLLAMLPTVCITSARAADAWFEIQVIDRQTRRGLPLAELTTINDVVLVTDNAGRVALNESERFGETLFFHVKSPGYALRPDGFGIAGVRLKPVSGGKAVIELDRINLAERLYRITGQDLYLDTVRLGLPAPLQHPLGSGLVAGQDSVQVAAYRNRLCWFWGDTNRLSYPLGLFRTAGATSPLPPDSPLPAAEGLELTYFTETTGFARAMVDLPNPEGVVWTDGVCTVTDRDGRERLVAHFSRRRGLADPLEQGLLLYNDERDVFERLTVLPLEDTWRFVRDHPARTTMDGVEYLIFGSPFPVTRVRATLEAVSDPEQYESWTCSVPRVSTTAGDSLGRTMPHRDPAGRVIREWKKQPPTTQKEEMRWLRQGLLKPDETWLVPASATVVDAPATPSAKDGGQLVQQSGGDDAAKRNPLNDHVLLHSGSVFFNAWRQRWVMIAVATGSEKNSPSFLGEVWYSEAVTPQGPFRRAVKVATHPGQSFYNPCHHPFLDEDGGKRIYFEGTYCNTFTSSPATPRYNYNQLMYRLDLDQPALRRVFREE